MNIDKLQRLLRHLYCMGVTGQGIYSDVCPSNLPNLGRELLAATVKGIRRGQSPQQISAQLGIPVEAVEAVRAELKNRYVPLMIWGEAGIGKSETVKAVADRLRIEFVDLRLGQLEPGDLIGQPRSERVYPCVYDWQNPNAGPKLLSARYSQAQLYHHILSNFSELVQGRNPGEVLQEAIQEAQSPKYMHLIDYQMVYSVPSWFPRPNTHGILFLDEMNRSHADVRAAVFQLVLDRKMHTLELPHGWIVVSANNPNTQDYGQTQSLDDDKAFISRFMHVALEPDFQEWANYALEADIDPTIRSFLRSNSTMLGLPKKDTVLPKTFPTPRTWVMLSNVLPGLSPDLINEVAAGLVGVLQATAWARLKTMPAGQGPVLAEELFADYGKARARLMSFLNFPDPEVDEKGNPVMDMVVDAQGNPVIDPLTGQSQVVQRKVQRPRTDMLSVTFDDLTSLFHRLSARSKELMAVDPQASTAFLNSQKAAMAPTFKRFMTDAILTTEQGGLGMMDIAHNHGRYWLKAFPNVMVGMIESIMPELASALAVIGQGSDSNAGRGGRRPVRLAGPDGFGAMPEALEAIARDPFGARQRPTPASSMAGLRSVHLGR